MSTTNTQDASKTATPSAPARTLRDRFGNGKYFGIQCEVFQDIKRIFAVDEEKAEKVSIAVATNLGAIFARGQVDIKGLDKLNKDGKLKTVREITKVKDLPLSHEVALLRAIEYCNNAHANHVHGVFRLDDGMQDWLNKL